MENSGTSEYPLLQGDHFAPSILFLHRWMNALFAKGSKKSLEEGDLDDPPKADKADGLCEKLERYDSFNYNFNRILLINCYLRLWNTVFWFVNLTLLT